MTERRSVRVDRAFFELLDDQSPPASMLEILQARAGENDLVESFVPTILDRDACEAR